MEKENNIKKINIAKILVIVNICIICFNIIFRKFYMWTMVNYPIFIALIIINIITVIVLFNKKIAKSKLANFIIVLVYLLLMIVLPVLKLELHEHVHTGNMEVIKEYTDYYNCYMKKLHRIYK